MPKQASGRRGTIVFSHANGFPAGTYRVLFEHWIAAGWDVRAIEKFGHDERYPVSSNWPRLRDQLLDFVAGRPLAAPVFLVGHSMGGYISLLAACHQPEAAAGIVMLDSPLVTGWRARSVQLMKIGGVMRRVSPGRVSVRRRSQWPSTVATLAHFGSKPGFARWHPEVLRDYVSCGTEPDPDGEGPEAVRLAFRREVETRIYNSLPHHLGTLLRRHPLRCPAGFVAGTRSREVRATGLQATQAIVGARLEWVEGSHLFPMEAPQAAAEAVLRMLASMAQGGVGARIAAA